MGKVTKGSKEEVKEGMEEPKDIREEVKEGTKDGTRQEEARRRKVEVKEASSRTASGSVSSAAARGTLPPTAQEALTRSIKAQGGQPG